MKLLNIAKKVRKSMVEIYDEPLQAVCLDASRELRDALNKAGFDAMVVQGTFSLDDPWFDDDGEEICKPLHYWVEVDGKILDLTATQFQDHVECDELETIVYGDYDDYERYTISARGWE